MEPDADSAESDVINSSFPIKGIKLLHRPRGQLDIAVVVVIFVVVVVILIVVIVVVVVVNGSVKRPQWSYPCARGVALEPAFTSAEKRGLWQRLTILLPALRPPLPHSS